VCGLIINFGIGTCQKDPVVNIVTQNENEAIASLYVEYSNTQYRKMYPSLMSKMTNIGHFLRIIRGWQRITGRVGFERSSTHCSV